MFESVVSLLVSICLLVGVHRSICHQNDTSGQRQQKLIRAIVHIDALLLISCLLFVWLLGWWKNNPFSSITYILLAFNAFSYSYFHLFNMSETGRRIRMLREIKVGGLKTEKEIQNVYSVTDMIEERLHRLQDLGQIKLNAVGNYQTSGYLLIFMAKIFRKTRKIVLGRNLLS